MDFLKSTFSRVPKHQRFYYKPRYVKEDEHLDDDKPFKIRKNRFFAGDGNGVAGAFRREPISYREKGSKPKRNRTMMLLMAMASLMFAFYMYDASEIGVLLLLVIFLVIFIKENNKR